MSDQFAKEATHNLSLAVQQWKLLVGGLIGPGGSVLDAPIVHQCAETYGFGRCIDDYTLDQQRIWKCLLDDLVLMCRYDPISEYGYKKLNLFSIGRPEVACGAGDVPPPRETVDEMGWRL
jgi:hypothetical protein